MIKLVFSLIFCVFAFCAFLNTTYAEGEKPIPEEFSKIDTDGDGKLSMDEFKAAFPGKPGDDTNERFKHADKNNDKYLSPDELNAAHGTAPDKSKAKDKTKKTDETKKE